MPKNEAIRPVLAYDESAIPATSLRERLELAVKENLALEIANKGNLEVELYRQSAIATVQAYAMHEFHPLHRDRLHRQEAFRHVCETLQLAACLNAPRIVTVCGFGYELADRPFERALEFFRSLVVPAKDLGIRIMIEPLSPRRAAALTDPHEIATLIESLHEPEVFSLMLDTGHLTDSGFDLDSFFQNWNLPIEELQLKGAISAPPQASIPVKAWLEALPELPSVVCVEHRQPISQVDFDKLIVALRQAIDFANQPANF
jgi:sugar phosphate isomerase/epimerase